MGLARTNRLIIVSNRLPISVAKENGQFTYKKSVGGLTTGLESFYEERESL